MAVCGNFIKAQDTLLIKGKVIDSSTGEAIMFANLLIPELNQNVQGDKDGNFEIEVVGDLENHSHFTLKAHFTGYPDSDTIFHLTHYFRAFNKKTLNVEMELRPIIFSGHIIPEIHHSIFWKNIKWK